MILTPLSGHSHSTQRLGDILNITGCTPAVTHTSSAPMGCITSDTQSKPHSYPMHTGTQWVSSVLLAVGETGNSIQSTRRCWLDQGEPGSISHNPSLFHTSDITSGITRFAIPLLPLKNWTQNIKIQSKILKTLEEKSLLSLATVTPKYLHSAVPVFREKWHTIKT